MEQINDPIIDTLPTDVREHVLKRIQQASQKKRGLVSEISDVIDHLKELQIQLKSPKNELEHGN